MMEANRGGKHMTTEDVTLEPIEASPDLNEMWAEVQSLPTLIRGELQSCEEKVRHLLNHNEVLSVKEVYTAGSGDSYSVGVAAEMAFEELTGLPTRALTGMAFSRYAAHTLKSRSPRDPLVVGISVSGEVARTIEAIKLARQLGALTVALTGDSNSRATQAAEKVLALPTERFGRSPGVRSYRMSLLGLFLLAIRLGEVAARYTQEEAKRLRNELLQSASAIERTIAASAAPALRAAEEIGSESNFVFVGSGPNYGTALFGATKVVEASGKHVIGQDIEEWAHLQYFSVDPATPTVVIAPPGRSYDRAVEIVEVMWRLGRRIIAIVAEGDRQITPMAHYVLPVSGDVREMFSPLIYAAGTELLAAAVARTVGESYFRQGNPSYSAGNGIRNSKIWESF
jgi:glucosamine--fructose-6-phosphate aminotransferase (isomerizing)